MKIVTRYILKQVLLIFFISITLMTFAFTLYIVSEATIKRGLPVYLSIRLVPFAMPYLLSITLPVATLLACSLFYAKMAGSNELIALKSLGIAPWRVFLPVWILTVLLSLLAVWCNDLAISWGRREMSRVAFEGTEAMILGRLASEHRFSDKDSNFLLTVSEVTEDGRLIHPTFSGKKISGEGAAESGRLTVDFTGSDPILKIELTDVIFKNSGGVGLMPQSNTFEYPLSQLALGGGDSGDPPMAEVDEEIERILAEKEARRRNVAAYGAFALVSGNYGEAVGDRWVDALHKDSDQDANIRRCRLAKPRRIASGFSCFFFAWVGIPLAVWLNRSDYFASFFACFLPILIIYYPLLMVGLTGAKSGALPPSFCWCGNIVLAVVGFYLLKKIHRH